MHANSAIAAHFGDNIDICHSQLRWSHFFDDRLKCNLSREVGIENDVREALVQGVVQGSGAAGSAAWRHQGAGAGGRKGKPGVARVNLERLAQAWCAGIIYIPMWAGFPYLAAAMDWATRFVLSWRLSNTLDAALCVEVLDVVSSRLAPAIFNADQGAQFNSLAFTERVLASGARCSITTRQIARLRSHWRGT